MIPMKRQYLVLYRDNDARMHEGLCWNAHTFDTIEERDEMIADLNNPKGVWGKEAVTIVISEVMVPVVAVLEEAVK